MRNLKRVLSESFLNESYDGAFVLLATKNNPDYVTGVTTNPSVGDLKTEGYKQRKAKGTYHIASKGGDFTGVIEYTVFEKSVDVEVSQTMKKAGVKGGLQTVSVLLMPKPLYELLLGAFDGFVGYELL